MRALGNRKPDVRLSNCSDEGQTPNGEFSFAPQLESPSKVKPKASARKATTALVPVSKAPITFKPYTATANPFENGPAKDLQEPGKFVIKIKLQGRKYKKRPFPRTKWENAAPKVRGALRRPNSKVK